MTDSNTDDSTEYEQIAEYIDRDDIDLLTDLDGNWEAKNRKSGRTIDKGVIDK